MGREIPRDLLLAGAIDGPETQAAAPAVTAIDIHPDLQGRAAAELLIGRLEGGDEEGPRITPHRLRVRASTTR